MNPESPSPGSHVEWELMQNLLFDGEKIYPWNPLALESEAYFGQLEELMVAEAPELVDRLDRGCQTFYHNLDCLWDTLNLATPAIGLQTLLEQQFNQVVPQSLLAKIAVQAEVLKSSSDSLAEQLIHCVQESLPQWDVEDLFVLARPFAYTMRGTEEETALGGVLHNAKTLHWETCSELEQARLMLAIARYAIAHRDRY